MFHRRARRIASRLAGRENIPPMLQRAHQMMEAGDYPNAAQTFHMLAQGAEERVPHRAPFLYLQAGRAAILSGERKPGMADLRRGLTLLADQQRFPRMHNLGNGIVSELQAQGLEAEAQEIRQLLEEQIPAQMPKAAAVTPARKPALPTHCPACGAVVKADEIEWQDEITAECSYCDSPIRAEK